LTAGSCFAQHISRALVKSGFTWIDSEPAPATVDPAEATADGYGVFSFRTGNIYTPALLKQWIEMALEGLFLFCFRGRRPGRRPPDSRRDRQNASVFSRH
jgi:hypothetical protein